MQHPTEPLAARDATPGWRCRRQRQDPAIVEPLVIPFVVVVRDELADGATPRALADQDHALEAGVLDGAPEALRGSSSGSASGRGVGLGVTSAGGSGSRPAGRKSGSRSWMRNRMCRRHPSSASVACPHELGAPRGSVATFGITRESPLGGPRYTANPNTLWISRV